MTDEPKLKLSDEDAAIVRRLIEGLARMSRGEQKTCLHCEAPIEELEQDGRCVYAKPCGCRQYQGTLPRKADDHE